MAVQYCNYDIKGTLAVASSATITGALNVTEYIFRTGQSSNYHRFLSSRQIFVVGNASSIDLNNGVSTFGATGGATTLRGTSMTLDASADITVDAGGGDIILSDDGTIFGTISSDNGTNLLIRSRINNADMFFRGVDGGTEFNALTLDMSDGGNATFAGAITSGAHIINSASDGLLTLNQTGTDTGWSYVNFNTLGTRNYYVGQDSSKNFNIFNDNIDVIAISVSYASNLTTIGGDLTVSGGDISLGGTGRITGVDTVSASTDAANKAYVDAHVSPAGTYLPLAGGTMTGNIDFGDNVRARFGNGDDLQIVFDGNNSFIHNVDNGNLYLRQQATDKDIILECDDGSGGLATYFQLDGSEGLNRFYKNALFQDNVSASFGGGFDLQIYHNATDSVIENLTGDLYITNKADDRDIIFRSDNGSGSFTEYLRLDGGAVITVVSKDFKFSDNITARFGNSDDLQIYHDGSNSYINEIGTGSLVLKTGTLLVRNPSNASMIDAFSGGVVNLYYDGQKRFETGSGGVEVQGNVRLKGTVPSVIFEETDVTANWRNRVSSGSYRVQYASDGSTFTDFLTLGASANTVVNDTIFSGNVTATNILTVAGAATGSPFLQFTQGGTQKAYIQYVDSGDSFELQSDNQFVVRTGGATIALTINSSQNATFAGQVQTGTDLIVGGGDITLVGTGRIQGIDTVSAGTDAASKAYVDNAVTGGLTFKDGFNAGSGAINGGGNLTTGGSRVAISVGDYYVVTTSGSFYGSISLDDGDSVICKQAAATGTSDINDWVVVQSDEGVSQFTSGNAITASSGQAITSQTAAVGSVTVQSFAYDGGTDVGHVPTGGSSSTFLRGDGNWVTPTNSGGTVTSVATTNGITGGTITGSGTIQLDGTVVRTTGAQSIAGVKTFSNNIIANGGINGSNYNINGVNQLSINDPGEGIVFNGTTTLFLDVIDDTADDKLRLRNATQFDLNSTARITNLVNPTGAQDGATKSYVDTAVSGAGSGTFLPLAGGTMTGTIIQNGGNIDFSDGRSANFGTGDDLEIFHSGTASVINNKTGGLLLKAL